MPFTFSHPAIILPSQHKLLRRWFSLTGLVIGSLTPDFEYYIRMDVKRVYTHTWTGLFLYDLPLGVLLAFLFHNVVRNAFILNTPVPVQKRLAVYKDFNWNTSFKKNWLLILISFLLGELSHIFWDSFTHWNHFFVRQIGLLHARFKLGHRYFHGYTIMQFSSSILGVLLILIALWKLPADKGVPVNRNIGPYWIFAASITLIIFAIRMTVDTISYDDIQDVLVPAISAFLIAIILTPLFLNLRTGTRKQFT